MCGVLSQFKAGGFCLTVLIVLTTVASFSTAFPTTTLKSHVHFLIYVFLFHWLLPLTLRRIGALRHNHGVARMLCCLEISSAKKKKKSILHFWVKFRSCLQNMKMMKPDICQSVILAQLLIESLLHSELPEWARPPLFSFLLAFWSSKLPSDWSVKPFFGNSQTSLAHSCNLYQRPMLHILGLY